MYCEDVAEAFDVVLHRGEVGHVYNIAAAKERGVVDVARDICGILGVDAEKAIRLWRTDHSMTRGTLSMVRR